MTSAVRIPADVEIADRVIGPFTARQVIILGATGLVLYALWDASRALVPAPVFLAAAVPVAVTAVVVALGRRDGLTLDRLLLAAVQYRATSRLRVARSDDFDDESRSAPAWLRARQPEPDRAPDRRHRRPAPLRLPARSVHPTHTNGVGVVDLGGDGLALIAVASTVNFALRTPAEQEALAATFGRYLHSLTAPVQILIRAERLDLTAQVHELRDTSGQLPHPALQTACLEHADYLTALAEQTVLLRRQVLLILREPLGTRPTDPFGEAHGFASARSALASLLRRRSRTLGAGPAGPRVAARRAAETRLVRRLGEAIELLAPAGITVAPLDGARTAAVLAASCNPDSLLSTTSRTADSDAVVGGAPGRTYEPELGWWDEDSEADSADDGRDWHDGLAWEDDDPDDGEWDNDEWDNDDGWDDESESSSLSSQRMARVGRAGRR